MLEGVASGLHGVAFLLAALVQRAVGIELMGWLQIANLRILSRKGHEHVCSFYRQQILIQTDSVVVQSQSSTPSTVVVALVLQAVAT